MGWKDLDYGKAMAKQKARMERAQEALEHPEWTHTQKMRFINGGNPGKPTDKETYEGVYRDTLAGLEDSPPEVPGFVEDDPFEALVLASLGPSNMGKAKADAQAIKSQRKALGSLEDIYTQGGLTAIDRARIADARAQEDQYVRAQRGAVQADLAERGLLGSGLEMLGRMDAAQDAGQRLSTAGTETQALALARRDEALAGIGDLSSKIRDQSWAEDSARAEAQDAIDQLNWEATNKANVVNWETAENRKMRKTDRLQDYGWDKYGSEYDALGFKLKTAGAGAGIDLDYKANDRANKSFDHEKKQDRINVAKDWLTFGLTSVT